MKRTPEKVPRLRVLVSCFIDMLFEIRGSDGTNLQEENSSYKIGALQLIKTNRDGLLESLLHSFTKVHKLARPTELLQENKGD